MAEREFHAPANGAIYMKQLGFNIFPLKPNAKTPAHKNWQEQAKTFEEGTISSYIMGHGCNEANFGVAPDDSFFVVDIDNKDGKTGSHSWEKLIEQHGECDPTFTVTTPTGGRHLYFRGVGRTTQSTVGQHIDTRASGGYASG